MIREVEAPEVHGTFTRRGGDDRTAVRRPDRVSALGAIEGHLPSARLLDVVYPKVTVRPYRGLEERQRLAAWRERRGEVQRPESPAQPSDRRHATAVDASETELAVEIEHDPAGIGREGNVAPPGHDLAGPRPPRFDGPDAIPRHVEDDDVAAM